MNYVEDFKGAIRAHGLIPPPTFIPGKIHRIDRVDKRKGHKSGWCKLFDDGNGGIYGDFSLDISETWQAKRPEPWTPEERQEYNRHVAESRKQEEFERKQKADEAAKQSLIIWRNAKTCTTHPYCEKKRIEPYPARVISTQAEECKGWFWTTDDNGDYEELKGNLLLLPLYNINNERRGLQAIAESGKKSFIKGLAKQCLFIPVTDTKLPADYAGKIYIGEGFSTIKTVRQATNDPTVAAIDSGNLLHVATAWRLKCPKAEIIIAGDIDSSGTGQTAANAAALAVSGLVVLPHFGDEELAVDPPPSDWNDFAVLHGLEAAGCALMKTTPPSDTKATPESNNDIQYGNAIKKLAALKPHKFDWVRKDEARKLGVKLPTLEADVKAARHDENESKHLLFSEVEPHPEPIDPAQLLNEVLGAIRQFIVLDTEQAQAAALWVASTWFIDAVEISPLAIINAPERECGKTQLLTVLGRMSYRPLPASNATASALFRAVELWKPTILIDEADTFFRDKTDLHSMVNAGYLRDGYVLRSEAVGDTFEPRKFSVFSAKALAGIALEKHLTDATMSRGVVFNLRRKLPHESVSRFRNADRNLFKGIVAKLSRFAEDYSQQVRDARPTLPEALSDRDQDNWEPLLAIAECAGVEWTHRATKAALKLSCAGVRVVSKSNELLTDIQKVFEEKELDKIFTKDLTDALNADEEKPWATYNRGKPIAPSQVSNRLTGYGIKSKTIRTGYKTAKGFEISQFDDAFNRYLATPPNLPSQGNNPPKANNGAGLDVTFPANHKVTQIKKVTPEPAPVLDCDVVTSKKPISGGTEEEFSKPSHIRI